MSDEDITRHRSHRSRVAIASDERPEDHPHTYTYRWGSVPYDKAASMIGSLAYGGRKQKRDLAPE